MFLGDLGTSRARTLRIVAELTVARDARRKALTCVPPRGLRARGAELHVLRSAQLNHDAEGGVRAWKMWAGALA